MYFLMKAALFFSRLIALYSFLIWIRIFISWVVPYPRPGSFTYYLGRIVDPYLGLFRSEKARIGVLDFSPIIAVGILAIFQSILQVYGTFGFLTFGYILAVVIQAIWSYGISVFLWISIIMLIFRTIASFSSNPAFYNMQRAMSFTNPIINFVQRCFGSRIMKDRTVNIISLVVALMLYFVLKRGFTILAYYALRIPF